MTQRSSHKTHLKHTEKMSMSTYSDFDVPVCPAVKPAKCLKFCSTFCKPAEQLEGLNHNSLHFTIKNNGRAQREVPGVQSTDDELFESGL